MKEDQYNEELMDKPRRGTEFVKLRIDEPKDRCEGGKNDVLRKLKERFWKHCMWHGC